MSDDTDVEQLLDKFQKALETLNNIENVEELINRLDANKSRKLLKKVKHVVGEVHNVVGNIKEKVSKAYRNVKNRNESEQEEPSFIDSTDKEVSDQEKDLELEENSVSDCRVSPIIGGKGKYSDKSCRRPHESSVNKNIEDTGFHTNKKLNSVDISENRESEIVNDEGQKDLSSGKETLQDNVQQNKCSDLNSDKEKECEEECTQDLIEGTPEKSQNKISFSLKRNITAIGEKLNKSSEKPENREMNESNSEETNKNDFNKSGEHSSKESDAPLTETSDNQDENSTGENKPVEDVNRSSEAQERTSISNKNDEHEKAELSHCKAADEKENYAMVVPKIKLVDISKLLDPKKQPLDVMTPSPKAKKSVTFDSSVIILSSSDEETPKKDPKNKDQSPLKSAMRKSMLVEDSDSDTKENNENLRNRKSSKKSKRSGKKHNRDSSSEDSDSEMRRKSRRLKKTEECKNEKFSKLAKLASERKLRLKARENKLNKDHRSNSADQKTKKGNNRRLLSESDEENDLDSVETRRKCTKSQRKQEIVQIIDDSEQSDNSGSDAEVTSRKKKDQSAKSNRKQSKYLVQPDVNDPKLKENVVIRLPSYKCEQLKDVYEKMKDKSKVKKIADMDSDLNVAARSSDKPEKKRIKLTLKLKRIDQVVNEEKKQSIEKKNDDVDCKEDGGEKEKAIEAIDQITITEDDEKNSDEGKAESDLNESETNDPEIKKNKKVGNKDKESEKSVGADEENVELKSDEDNKGEESNTNKDKSDNEEIDGNDENCDKIADETENNDEDKSRTNKSNNKKSNHKVDSSDSDDDFAKYSKKKQLSNSELMRKTKKRMLRSAVISDSESEEHGDKITEKSDDDDDDGGSDNKSKDPPSNSECEDKDDETDEETKKSSRKRIKRAKDSSSDDEDKSTRKHLRKMIDRDSLSETTKRAEQEEKNRKARIAEKQKKYNQIFDLKTDAIVDKVVLDFDEKTNKPLLSVHQKLVKQLKPHQVHGVKFMWDACFESLERLKKDKGSGCILAHCMGLGKTLQVIALSHALLTNSNKTKVEKIMVVCPVNTVLNWKSEFKKWMPKGDDFEIYDLVSCKTSSINHERNYKVTEWHENGGVLIIGYNMFRTLSNPENKSLSKKLRQSFQTGLVDPGPDLVVCDEGHLLKNEKTNLSIAMNRIRTLRRIVLTGTPLQNNLREYWCMVQFIKPNLLGTYKEYLNRFVNPITNGQYTDSTQHDILIMRRRSHVLHKLLDGVVQRQDYSVLAPYLPPKHEYVLFLKLTEVQAKLYNHYMSNFAKQGDGSNRTSFLFNDFQQFQRICTHPRVLLDKSLEDKDKKLNDDTESEGSLKDFIDDESEAESSADSESSASGSGSDTSIRSEPKKKSKHRKHAPNRRTRVTRAQAAQKRQNSDGSDSEVEILGPKEWWQDYIDNEELDNINHSAKLFLLFQILKECEEIGDKILVFSQSLYTLNCIEYFLQRIDEATQQGDSDKVGGHSGSWAIGLDYFRLDGSSSCDNRASWCDQFNDPSNTRARLFLISTKAGGLGINLVAANRVIIFDVSWNPSHDIQSIYRVYRFGQTKPSYIYRFVTYGTMEMKIYERQVTKQAISKRVIDEQQIDRHYSQTDIQELYKTDLEPTDRPIPLVPKDVLLGEMLMKYDKTIFKYHEHQSLLENKQDEELNEEERKAAWDEFENEKVLRKNTVSNLGGLNLAAFQNTINFTPQLIQIALANIVQKDNPTWSEVQIKGILPALVTQLQMQMSENDFSMYTRVQQEIRLMQALQAQRMRESYIQQYQLQQMLHKQQLANQMLGNMNITPEEMRLLQASASSQNFIQPPQKSTAGMSADIIELND